MSVERVGVSIEPELLQEFDSLVRDKGYSSRSEAIRDMVRKELLDRRIDEGSIEIIGTLTYVYDHHEGEVSDRLIELQHHHTDEILFNTHVHMDRDMCLEVLIVKGESNSVRSLADRIKAVKGVKNGELVIAAGV